MLLYSVEQMLRVHASVLSLYDVKRLQGPKANGSDITWEDLNLQVGAKLKALAATGKEVVLLNSNFCESNHIKNSCQILLQLSKC